MYYGGRGGYNNNHNNNNRAGYNFPNGPRGGNNNMNNFNSNPNYVTVEIQGWNNASPQEVISFLNRKTRVELFLGNVVGNIVQAQVKTMKDADIIARCSGMRFAGQALHCRIANNNNNNNNHHNNSMNGGGNPAVNVAAKDSTITILRNFLISRYNQQNKMLDLQSCENDQVLASNGLFSNASTSSKFFPALMKIAEQEKLDVESVNLSGNNINDYSKWLSDLSHSFPHVKNIAMANNNVKKIEFFDKLKNKFNSLRELIIQGNPISQNMTLVQKIVEFFPRLVIIDGNQVRDEQKINRILTFPIKSTKVFFENEDFSKISTTFLTSYLNFWDNNRVDLMSLYTPQSQFSYQCDSSVISDFNANTPTNLWNNYTPHSRNFKRVSNEKSRSTRLSIGPEQILNTFKCLPKSKHNLDTNPNEYSIETVSFPSLNGIMISIHGEFDEIAQPEQQFAENSNNVNNRYNKYNNKNNKGGSLEKRCFDRVFVVVPGPNGAFIVASDLLCVKHYSKKKSWNIVDNNSTNINNNAAIPAVPTPSITPVNNGVPMPPMSNSTIPNALPPDIASKLNITQQEIVMKIMQETRLKLEFVLMLCEQSNWDYNTAGINFTNSKAQIPPDAYLQ